jgi:hypothetical protein
MYVKLTKGGDNKSEHDPESGESTVVRHISRKIGFFALKSMNQNMEITYVSIKIIC